MKGTAKAFTGSLLTNSKEMARVQIDGPGACVFGLHLHEAYKNQIHMYHLFSRAAYKVGPKCKYIV